MKQSRFQKHSKIRDRKKKVNSSHIIALIKEELLAIFSLEISKALCKRNLAVWREHHAGNMGMLDRHGKGIPPNVRTQF